MKDFALSKTVFAFINGHHFINSNYIISDVFPSLSQISFYYRNHAEQTLNMMNIEIDPYL